MTSIGPAARRLRSSSRAGRSGPRTASSRIGAPPRSRKGVASGIRSTGACHIGAPPRSPDPATCAGSSNEACSEQRIPIAGLCPAPRPVCLGLAHQLQQVRRPLADRPSSGTSFRDHRVHARAVVQAHGADAVVTVDDPVTAGKLHQIDRRQRLKALVRLQNPLPAGLPVVAAELSQRQEIAAALGGAGDGRAEDLLDGMKRMPSSRGDAMRASG